MADGIAGGARALMIQGTGSDVGKSLLVAALARAYTRRGLRVRPFKPQNMSNNAAVTPDGGEIGRAQALQARACGVPPSVDMNPVLLKPQTDVGAQLVLRGRVLGNAEASAYQRRKGELLPAVLESFHRLRADCDLVVVEGAGSPAETNLRAGDIANMGFARAAGVPVVLAGDIDRGGVIASLVGTHHVLDVEDRAQIRGFLINKFRGDVRLFEKGVTEIEARTRWPCFGVMPHQPAAARLPAEDGMDLAHWAKRTSGGPLRIAVPMLSRIANFDDLDPLRLEPGVTVEMVPPGRPLPGDAQGVILPGSKATLADLAFFRAQGWDVDLAGHVRRGGWVLGLCGGYQMLGRVVADPDGIEGPPGTAAGLGYLDVETVLAPAKTLRAVTGRDAASGAALTGYEMHLGVTQGPDRARPLLHLDAEGGGMVAEGAVSFGGRIAGTYVHGLFGHDAQRAAWLKRWNVAPGLDSYDGTVEAALNELAMAAERHLDLDALWAISR
ncbi:cobyric acid synthase [Nitrospirillum sp. BR 11163]|uniref:cobyric acid synthase n=1 Tax=Nitrospirillum sp. BR 11163 TaxID=3104323 RepID=UPI002AFDD510|nr:cobyric acid synthase [Nitrospirillum sp. BR 11163]MEA1672538.1 cobyric acid synthase [Nitrospirillum sp. BR 11163]